MALRRLACVACVAGAIAPATALAAGISGTYRGRTTQGKTAVIRVRHGFLQRGSKIPFALQCQNGNLGGDDNVSGKLRRGRFSARGTVNAAVGGGLRAEGTNRTRFVVRDRLVTGSFTESDTIVSAAGAVVDHCSVTLTFRATR